jgi:polysaccharide deacetylase 2 family uncharacterized protein YibQ
MRDFIRSLFTKENLIAVSKTAVSTILNNATIRKIVASYVRDLVLDTLKNENVTDEIITEKTKLAQDVVESVSVGLKTIHVFKETGDVPQNLINALNAWSEGKPTPTEYLKNL